MRNNRYDSSGRSSESAHELEAITTIDYVAVEMLKNQGNDRKVIDKVQQMKGTKFSREYLFDCLKSLKRFKWYKLKNEWEPKGKSR